MATIVPVSKKNQAACLNDYYLVALTSIIMKCFKRLVMAQIDSSLLNCLDPLQFAYRCNRSTADAISLALHSALERLDNKDTYVRLLFIDNSSAFNTIIPTKLISKLRGLGLGTSLCNWILNFLTHRPRSSSTPVPHKAVSSAPYYTTYTPMTVWPNSPIIRFC